MRVAWIAVNALPLVALMLLRASGNLSLFAGYGIGSAFLIDHEENQRRTSALSTPR